MSIEQPRLGGTVRERLSNEEWATRVDLAAAYQAELLLLQVTGSPSENGAAQDEASPDLDQIRGSLQQFAHDLAVNRHSPFDDDPFARPPRGHPRLRQILLQPHHHTRTWAIG